MLYFPEKIKSLGCKLGSTTAKIACLHLVWLGYEFIELEQGDVGSMVILTACFILSSSVKVIFLWILLSKCGL